MTTEEEFLSSVQKFTSPWLDAIFGLTNLFFSLRDKNIVLSNNEIWLKEGSRQYKELVNRVGEKAKQLTVNLAKEVKDMERLRQLRDKYCSEAYGLREKAKVLQDKLDNLASNNKTPDHNLAIDSDDEDNSPFQPKSSWQSILVTTNCFTSAKSRLGSQTPRVVQGARDALSLSIGPQDTCANRFVWGAILSLQQLSCSGRYERVWRFCSFMQHCQ